MKTFEGWYCAHCQRGVDASEVTFHEQHTVCGRTITDDTPPEPPVKESLTTEQPEDGPAGWRPMRAHRPRYGQRVFLRRNGIVQIGSPTFDGGDDGDFWDFDTFGIDSAEVDWESDEWMPIDDLGDCLDAVKAERDALRERVKELVEIIGDIKRWDISNLLLDIPHPLRKRMQAVLAAMQEGKS